MSEALIVVGVLVVGLAIGLPLSWRSMNCYPWRRCGKCGWQEWAIFRRRS